MKLVTRNYWWPEVTKNIEKYVEGCDLLLESQKLNLVLFLFSFLFCFIFNF